MDSRFRAQLLNALVRQIDLETLKTQKSIIEQEARIRGIEARIRAMELFKDDPTTATELLSAPINIRIENNTNKEEEDEDEEDEDEEDDELFDEEDEDDDEDEDDEENILDILRSAMNQVNQTNQTIQINQTEQPPFVSEVNEETRSRLVAMLDGDKSKIIKVFTRQKDAADEIGKSISTVNQAIRNDRLVGSNYFMLWPNVPADIKATFLATNTIPDE